MPQNITTSAKSLVEAAEREIENLSVEDAIKQANWGPYADWFIREQQAPIAIRKVYEEIEGKLPAPPR